MSGLTTPAAWTVKAERTLDAVRVALTGNTERTFPAHWTDDTVRDLLLDLVGHKCWYCESTIQRADVNVDHFRPKSEVLDVPGHHGYWWLAYEVANYRISCKHCNSGGARFNGVREGRAKGSQFPLLAGPRAWNPRDDLSLEQPLILDPARRGDPDLLGFDTAGYARRSDTPYSQVEAKSDVCRAEETIRILALNATQIREQRSHLMEEVTWLARLPSDLEVQKRIDERVSHKAQWSAAAAAALALQRACDRHIDEPDHSASMPTRIPVIDPARSRVDVRDLLEHLDPVELEVGITLTGQHDKTVHHAVLQRDGQISVLGRPWRTPTTAARAATGSNKIDGWEFWHLTIAGVEQSLAEFRAQHPLPAPPA